MFYTINIAAGLAVALTAIAGGLIFVITLFSLSATIISAGFVLTALIGLVAFALCFWLTSRVPPQQRGPNGTAVVQCLQAVLLATNVMVVAFAPPLAIGVVSDPRFAAAVPVSEGAVVVGVLVSSVLGLALLLERTVKGKS